jgi:sugar transferase (PEP-CTERM/EpsH1 system associated)
MRIAFVTVRIPYPLNSGGRIRSFHLLKQLSESQRVTLVTGIESEEEARAAAALREQIPALELRAVRVPPRNAPLRAAARALRNPFDPLPYTWAAYRDRRFVDNVARTLREGPYDIVHCDHVQIAHAVLSVETPPRVLNAHNVDSLLVQRLAEVEPRRVRRGLVRWQAAKVARAERRTYHRFDAALAMSDVDREQLLRIAPGIPVWTVPNGVDVEWFKLTRVRPEPDLLVFSGAMDWQPNADAVVWFAQRVLPLIRRERPRARFLVVGRDPSPALVSRLAAEPGVSFTGTVDDVRPHLAQAALIVVPLRVGSGTRLKILEAWAMAKPVLSTTLGAEGLPGLDGEHLVLADEPEQMAARALELLSDPGRAEQLGMAGRQVAEAQFSWKRISERLVAAYEAVLAGPTPATRSGR